MEPTTDREELAHLWHLWCVRGVSHRHLERLRADTPTEKLWSLETVEAARRLRDAGMSETVAGRAAERIEDHPEPRAGFEAEHERLPAESRLLFAGQRSYPDRLFDLDEPPTFLYVRGSVDACRAERALAVVGSRDVTVEDARFARRIVGEVAEAGVRIVSGGAFGIDRVSHEAAIEAGTPTVVALPGGLDEPSPRSNTDVFEQAATCGALVTEYPLGTDVRPYHFPRRNRLIAALSDATFIVRAGEDSGTMLTAEAAREIGRPLCVLPGDPRDSLTAGCLKLLVDGAQAVRHGADILETFFPDLQGLEGGQSQVEEGRTERQRQIREQKLEQVSESARRLVETIEEADIDEETAIELDTLARVTGREASQLQSALLELELHGICEKAPGRQAYEF